MVTTVQNKVLKDCGEARFREEFKVVVKVVIRPVLWQMGILPPCS